jgi:PPK2 family polyphosphate:nucleotide phosphotransferase
MASPKLLSKRDRERFIAELGALRVPEGEAARLRGRPTRYTGDLFTKKTAGEFLRLGIERLAELQDKLYAHNQHGLLIVLQAMDAAGKDGAIRHIMSGLNPQGVRVASFKAPSMAELDHDFLWRHYQALPPRGEIGIFNRSHYENVLVSRVHPELVLRENLPSVRTVKDVTKTFWKERYHAIRQFEHITAHSGTSIVKFYLHLSKDEQRKRLLERIDDPAKNWKFSVDDLRERDHWDAYMSAYEDAITATSTDHAPWYVIPADDKWYARVAMATIIYVHMDRLGLSYPRLNAAQKKELAKARTHLVR